jgi:hypothetical protein
MTRPADAPSRSTLQRLPGRVLVFLQAIGTHPSVRAAMATGGFGPEDHAEGAELLAAVYAYGSCSTDGRDADALARQAQDEVREWVRTHFPRLRAAVERLHPHVPSPFGGIESPEPHQAVLALATLLERLDGAQSSPDVIATLARRGLGAEQRERLARSVATAQAARVEQIDAAEPEPRHGELVALHRWYTDWVTTARAVVGCKRLLIILGLASPRREADVVAP